MTTGPSTCRDRQVIIILLFGRQLMHLIMPRAGPRSVLARIADPSFVDTSGGTDPAHRSSICPLEPSTISIPLLTFSSTVGGQGKPSPNPTPEHTDLSCCSAIEGIDSSACKHYTPREKLSPACVARRFGLPRLRLAEKSGRARHLQTPASSHGKAGLIGLRQVLQPVVSSRRGGELLIARFGEGA